MSTLEEKITIMQAYQQGKQIEWKPKRTNNTEWEVSLTPIWDWSNKNYRIKEEPKKKVKLYQAVCLDNFGNYIITSRFYPSTKEAQDFLTLFKVIKLLPHTMIEVEEE